MTESELRAAVVKLAKSLGWLVFSLPIAKTRRPVKDAVGYPDLTLARNGTVKWIELKTQKGMVEADQVRWHAELPLVYVVRPDDIDGLADVLA